MTTYKNQPQIQPQEEPIETTTTEIITPEESQIPSLAGVFGRTRNEAAPAPYVSFRPVSAPDKRKLYQAMTNPDYRIADCINQQIRLVDVFVEWVEMVDRNTGETSMVPRIVLFDADGHTYAAVSRGIANSLERLSMVYGMPHWDEPITVKIRQVQAGERRFYSLDVV